MINLKSILQNNIITVIFTKKNGTEREMLCTLCPEYIPIDMSGTSTSVEKEGLLTVWDLENDGWRTIPVANIREIYNDLGESAGGYFTI